MPSTAVVDVKTHHGIWPYVQIARVDHWFKTAFMVLGVLLAFFYRPQLWDWSSLLPLAITSAVIGWVRRSTASASEMKGS